MWQWYNSTSMVKYEFACSLWNMQRKSHAGILNDTFGICLWWQTDKDIHPNELLCIYTSEVYTIKIINNNDQITRGMSPNTWHYGQLQYYSPQYFH